MTWLERWKKILAGEARDITDELGKLRESVDKELTRREREMSASPSEKLDMILEDIEMDSGRLDALEEELSRGVADHAVELPRPAAGAVDGPVVRQRARLLGPDDVSSSPHLAEVLRGISVEPRTDSDLEVFDHTVRIDEGVRSRIGREHFGAVVSTVEAHPLVRDVGQEGPGTLIIAAPTLHHDDVRLIVAAAYAEQVPDGEEEISARDPERGAHD